MSKKLFARVSISTLIYKVARLQARGNYPAAHVIINLFYSDLQNKSSEIQLERNRIEKLLTEQNDELNTNE